MERVDVAVVGLGAMGAAALWRLAERGASAAGFDSLAPPHDRGSSHGGSRIIRTAYAEGSFYVPLLLEAWPLWRELEAATGTTLLTLTGALMIGPISGDIVQGTLTSARDHGLPHELLTPAQAAARWPQHVFNRDDAVLYEPRAGFLRPEACIEAALVRAAALGAGVRRHTKVVAIDDGDNAVRLRFADGGGIIARRCIVAAGAWTGTVLPELRPSLSVERQVNAWFGLDDPAAFAWDRFPVFIRELADGRLRFGVPGLDGATVKVAVHHEGAAADPDSVDRHVTGADLAPVEEFVSTLLRGVRPGAVRSIVCMYTNTPDEAFIVGLLPGRPTVTVLGGCSGHSFKFASVLGDVAADLALEGGTGRAIASLAPARLTTLADRHPSE